MAGQSYHGSVKSFNPHKGWGFVESPTLGGDAFIIKSELRGYGVVKGDKISFQINQGPKGLSAVNIQVLNPNQDLFFGEVKSWNQAKGFGFITSIATQQLFAKDVFALQGEFRNGFGAQGIQVMFRARNAERGPIATDITILGPDGSGGKGGGAAGQQWGPGFSGKGASGFGGGGSGFGGGKGAGFGGGFGGGYGASSWGGDFSGGYGQQALPWKAPAEETVYFGTLKGINQEKGWGHIACEAMNRLLGKDIFVMKTSLDGRNIHVGQAVSFTLEQGPKGPHAVNIQPFDLQSAGMVFTGTVKSFNDVKGWGFVESPQAKQIFRSDFFIHKRELQGKVVHTGDQVQFAVDISGGRASAKNVSLGLGGARAAPGRY